MSNFYINYTNVLSFTDFNSSTEIVLQCDKKFLKFSLIIAGRSTNFSADMTNKKVGDNPQETNPPEITPWRKPSSESIFY